MAQTQATPTTIVAMIAELIETHMLKCGNDMPHVVTADHKFSTDIEKIENNGNDLFLDLHDGSRFTIRVMYSD